MSVDNNEIRLAVNTVDAVYPITVDPTFVQEQKLVANDPTSGTFFGVDVAIDNDTIVIGTRNDAAYVFVKDGDTWVQQAKLTPGENTNGSFGAKVVISNDTIAIGATIQDSGRGAVYVYVRNGAVWTQQQKLTDDDPTGGEQFGNALALEDDRLLVGCYSENSNFSQGGSVTYFLRTSGNWIRQQEFVPSNHSGQYYFGEALDMDGDTAVVGGSLFNSATGIAVVFTFDGAAWNEQAIINNPGGSTGDLFGEAVAISGNTIAVSAMGAEESVGGSSEGEVSVFEFNGTDWILQQKLFSDVPTNSQGFGGFQPWGKGLSLQGDRLAIGTFTSNAANAALYIFERNNNAWSLQQKIAAADVDGGNYFASANAMDDQTLVVGNPFTVEDSQSTAGSVLVFATDTDIDGIGDGVDNCPNVANPGQEDSNNNGIGDVCDAEILTFYLHGSDIAGTAGGYTMDLNPPSSAPPLSLNLINAPKWFSNPTLTGSFEAGNYVLSFPCSLGLGLATSFSLHRTATDGSNPEAIGSVALPLAICTGMQTINIPAANTEVFDDERLRLRVSTLLGLSLTLTPGVDVKLVTPLFSSGVADEL